MGVERKASRQSATSKGPRSTGFACSASDRGASPSGRSPISSGSSRRRTKATGSTRTRTSRPSTTQVRRQLGCRTFLSCISKGFGGFCSQLLRLRTGKLSSAFRLHSFADIFGHPCGDILDSNRGQRLGNEVVGEFTAHAGNQEN